MPRAARFPGRFSGALALALAMGALLGGSVLLAANASQPGERRVAWRGVSFVLPGGFVPVAKEAGGTGGTGGAAVFRDRLREQRELLVLRLQARPGSGGEAEVHDPDAGPAQAAPPPPDAAWPAPEAVLRLLSPSLPGGVRLPPGAAVDTGVKRRDDAPDVPFAAWTGLVAVPSAGVGQAARRVSCVMVTTDGAGAYAVMVLHDPAYRQDDLQDRVVATRALLQRTLETVRFRPVGPATRRPGGDA